MYYSYFHITSYHIYEGKLWNGISRSEYKEPSEGMCEFPVTLVILDHITAPWGLRGTVVYEKCVLGVACTHFLLYPPRPSHLYTMPREQPNELQNT